jgi:F-type H+-transporting ATPase subunit b
MAKRILQFLSMFYVLMLLVGSAWAETEGHAEAGAHAIDWMHGLVYPSINFFILIFLLYLFLRKPLVNSFRERSASLRLTMTEARTLYDKAYSQHQEIDTRLKNVDSQTRKLIADVQSEAENERKKLIQEAGSQSERIKSDAVRIAEQEVKKAFETIKAETVRLAMDLARTQVSAQLGVAEQKQLGDEFVTQLKKQGAA